MTSFYLDGVEVRDQEKIIKQYIEEGFISDVITFTALMISVQLANGWYSLLFLVRMTRITNLITRIDNFLQIEHKFPSSYQLLQLLSLIVLIGHFCGCGFIFLG